MRSQAYSHICSSNTFNLALSLYIYACIKWLETTTDWYSIRNSVLGKILGVNITRLHFCVLVGTTDSIVKGQPGFSKLEDVKVRCLYFLPWKCLCLVDWWKIDQDDF
ncbi:hypothetical protein SAY86_005631 [Trapa natans]|uniref:Uncharacterized protein n=1 Tax=Trapa natans TaxID=22666 RepID=A0AAN7QVM9_TRANT|nr:hypothetical protein SAY86_005631 [Trapa natans]